MCGAERLGGHEATVAAWSLARLMTIQQLHLDMHLAGTQLTVGMQAQYRHSSQCVVALARDMYQVFLPIPFQSRLYREYLLVVFNAEIDVVDIGSQSPTFALQQDPVLRRAFQ